MQRPDNFVDPRHEIWMISANMLSEIYLSSELMIFRNLELMEKMFGMTVPLMKKQILVIRKVNLYFGSRAIEK